MHQPNAEVLAQTTTAARFLHVTLPVGLVREARPCALGEDDMAALQEVVLPKLARGGLVLTARPRYRLNGALSAVGGRMYELRSRHGSGLVVARIGMGWRDHGASLVWAACARSRMLEPQRPWVVDALDEPSLVGLNPGEAAGISRWVPVLASDLAWAAIPVAAFRHAMSCAPRKTTRGKSATRASTGLAHATRARTTSRARSYCGPGALPAPASANRADARRIVRPRDSGAEAEAWDDRDRPTAPSRWPCSRVTGRRSGRRLARRPACGARLGTRGYGLMSTTVPSAVAQRFWSGPSPVNTSHWHTACDLP